MNRLLDLHFGEGRPRRMKRTARHVASCPECREEIRSLARAGELLAAWPDERPDAGTLDRVMAALPEARPRFRPMARPRPLLPLAGIAGGIAFIWAVLWAARSVLARFSFWEGLRAGWLARTFGESGMMLVAFLVLSGLAAVSMAPFLLDYAGKSDPCRSRQT
jgi:hypothetical protein